MSLNLIDLKLAKIGKKIIEKSIIILVILAIIWQFGFPRLTSLAYFDLSELTKPNSDLIKEIENNLLAELGQPIKVVNVPVTAYSSTPDQTDDTPCLTANDFNLCKNNEENVIAANFLPFGTKVRFPDYSPTTVYTVQDRMNARYAYRADIWMKTRANALNFGFRNLKMEIYK